MAEQQLGIRTLEIPEIRNHAVSYCSKLQYKLNPLCIDEDIPLLPCFVKNRNGEWFCWLAEILPPQGMVIRGPGWSSISLLMRGRHRCYPYVAHQVRDTKRPGPKYGRRLT